MYVHKVLATPIMICQKLGKGGMKGTDRDRGISGSTQKSSHRRYNHIYLDFRETLASEAPPHGRQ